MSTPFRRTQIASAVGAIVLALGTGHALAAGFILQENSGSGLGNAYAGGAAASEDADTVWTNPAGMSRLTKNQVAAAVNYIAPSIKFRNDGNSKNAAFQPLGSEGGNGGEDAFVPNLYAVFPMGQWAFGLGINAPFGLTTEYDSDWIGRYQAIKSKVETINVNPAISYKFGDWSIGAGANWQRIKADLTKAGNYSGGLAQAAQGLAQAGVMPANLVLPFIGATSGIDTLGKVTGDDDAWGWNAGIEWNIKGGTTRTRIGASYRSAIKYHITGNVEFFIPAAPTLPPNLAPFYGPASALVNANPQLQNGGVYSDIKLPDFANISIFHSTLSDKWDFMADAQWVHWSTIQDLTFFRNSGTVLDSTPERWKDTWRLSAGASYRSDERWTWRLGFAWDQSPVPDEFRTPRLPDTDRYWYTGGAQYKWSPDLKFDLGLAYLWIKNAPIAQISTNPATVAQVGYISGNYDNYTLIVSGQVTWSF